MDYAEPIPKVLQRIRPHPSMIKDYIMLTKPGIILGNAITLLGGFALASKGHINFELFLITLLGISFVIASACIFNNYIDRAVDEKMARTKNRALVTGEVSVRAAILLAISFGLAGTLTLAFFTNLLTVVIASIGFFVYVVVYGILKRVSSIATVIGSIAGAVPPVVGYTAVSNRFDLGAFIIFMIIALWQMPHFYAIAMYRLDDYKRAEIPVLPLKKGLLVTKIQMLLYVIAFTCSALMLTQFGYMGYAYMIASLALGVLWIGLSIKGFSCADNTLWARKMFLFSLVAVTVLCAMIPVDVLA